VSFGPFESTVDIAQFYQIDDPGVYTVYWGIEGTWSEEIVFKVIPHIIAYGIQRDQ